MLTSFEFLFLETHLKYKVLICSQTNLRSPSGQHLKEGSSLVAPTGVWRSHPHLHQEVRSCCGLTMMLLLWVYNWEWHRFQGTSYTAPNKPEFTHCRTRRPLCLKSQANGSKTAILVLFFSKTDINKEDTKSDVFQIQNDGVTLVGRMRLQGTSCVDNILLY